VETAAAAVGVGGGGGAKQGIFGRVRSSGRARWRELLGGKEMPPTRPIIGFGVRPACAVASASK
jgi:hypothetical protein